VPLEATPVVKLAARDELESRLDDSLNSLRVRSVSRSEQTVDHLCLFTRWYYRPQARRTGEAVFEETGEQSKQQLMRAISRVYRQAQAARDKKQSAQKKTSGESSGQAPARVAPKTTRKR